MPQRCIGVPLGLGILLRIVGTQHFQELLWTVRPHADGASLCRMYALPYRMNSSR